MAEDLDGKQVRGEAEETCGPPVQQQLLDRLIALDLTIGDLSRLSEKVHAMLAENGAAMEELRQTQDTVSAKRDIIRQLWQTNNDRYNVVCRQQLQHSLPTGHSACLRSLAEGLVQCDQVLVLSLQQLMADAEELKGKSEEVLKNAFKTRLLTKACYQIRKLKKAHLETMLVQQGQDGATTQGVDTDQHSTIKLDKPPESEGGYELFLQLLGNE
ncbi:hypothetical protein ACHAPT_006181 [Fusarium lateritium]